MSAEINLQSSIVKTDKQPSFKCAKTKGLKMKTKKCQKQKLQHEKSTKKTNSYAAKNESNAALEAQ